ncbi:MAG: DMT family transporter [Bacteroidaceae bacterium]|nr:DMT family transporter [Bacteroidaceae bacterium]
MSCKYHKAIFHALLAAALYAVSIPFSKLLLAHVPPTLLAALLYIGAGVGMAVLGAVRRSRSEEPLRRADAPYAVAMVVLDIAAPVLLMLGLKYSPAASASLLNNFEIVATAIIALMVFGEAVGKRLWAAIALITLSSILLTMDTAEGLTFSLGSLLVLGATICWGIENNCTRQIADRDPLQIVKVKGLGSGLGALVVALVIGEELVALPWMLATMVLGFVAYGLSIYYYTYAQRVIGAARTSAYYAIAPFIGVLLSMLILGERPGSTFFVALAIMLIGTYLASGKSGDSEG